MRLSKLWIAAMAVAACSMPTSVCGCTPALPFMVILTGTVTSGGATGASTVSLGATGTRGACPAAANASVTTLTVVGPGVDSTGVVRNALSATSPDTLCVRLVARRVTSGRIDSLEAPRVTAVFRQDPQADTIRLNLRFP